MLARTSILLAALFSLSACIATPRIEIPNTMSFNYHIENQAPMSYDDLLCCTECRA